MRLLREVKTFIGVVAIVLASSGLVTFAPFTTSGVPPQPDEL